MWIQYDVEDKIKVMEDNMIDYYATVYPFSRAVFIPFIRPEYRIDKESIQAGEMNDNILKDYHADKKKCQYLGTYHYDDEMSADYYLSPDGTFLYFLYTKVDELYYLNALFINSSKESVA